MLIGAVAMIHGINYVFTFDRLVTGAARVTFSVLGVAAMVHPNRTVQFGAVAVIVALSLAQTLMGRPDPVGVLRSLVGSTDSAPVEKSA